MKILVGDVAVGEQEFEWRLTTGVGAFVGRVRVGAAGHRQLLETESPTRVVMGCGDAEGQVVRFQGVRLVGWSRASLTEFEWRLADARVEWPRQRVRGEFNVAGELNDAELAELSGHVTRVVAGGGRLDGAEPALPAERYLAPTIRDGQPWTALELAEHLLAQVAGSEFGGRAHGLHDNAVIAQTVQLRGDENVLPVIAGLLREAEAEVAMCADGVARLVPAHELPESYLPDGAPVALESAGLTRVDAGTLRPSSVTVRVAREEQRAFTFATADANATAAATPGGGRLINVVRLPRDERLAAWGLAPRDWPAGSFVPMADAQAAWGIDDALIRQRWFAGDLEREYAEGGDNSPWNAEMLARVAALREHWRRTFAVHPDDRAEFASWRPLRLDHPDPHTKRPAPAVAIADHTIVPAWRASASALAGAGEPAASQSVSGVIGNVRAIDAAAAILRVEIPPRAGLRVIPGTVSPAPPAVLNRQGHGWHSSEIDADWTLTVALAVTPAEPGRRHHDVRFEAAALGVGRYAEAVGAPVRIDEPDGETARTMAATNETDPAPLNDRLLRELARRAGRRLMRATLPRWHGSITYEGWHEMPEPFGDLRAIIWRLGNDHRLTTQVVAGDGSMLVQQSRSESGPIGKGRYQLIPAR